jgi:tetratricopeptide (TPR) repeat protein
MPSKRLSKEELHDDEFMNLIYRLIGYSEENYPKILAGIGVVVVIGLIGYFIQQSSNRRTQAALDAIGVVQVALMQGNTSTAVTNAQSIIRDYEGEAMAGQALITLANIYFNQGRFEEAATHYRQFLAATDNSAGPEAYGAWSALGAAMEAQNDLDGAAQQYESYTQAHGATPFAPLALMEAARCYKMAATTLWQHKPTIASFQTTVRRRHQTRQNRNSECWGCS